MADTRRLGERGTRGAITSTGSKLSLYHELAQHYDALYSWKDYRAETRGLIALAGRYGRSGGRAWLDVACGTGRHLELLRRRFVIMGVDASPEMLRVAHRRLPGVRLVRGDMRTFRVPGQFDVVSCLFSAIGHLRDERDLKAAFENLAHHTKPGGVVLVQPWIEPSAFRPGHVHLTSFESPDATLVRLAHATRRGSHSVIQYEYLLAEPGHSIRRFSEIDLGFMVPHGRLARMLRSAGLRTRFVSTGLWKGRGLLIGLKPTVNPTVRR
jgi:SAM-dependent methyltransferase